MDKVLQKTWIGEYAGLKEKIYKAMQKSDRSAIEACFAEVRELIRRNEGKEPAKDVSVYIYYDLYNLIHRYIRDNGYSYEEIQQPQNANFVFGTDFSLDDMVIAMERLADTVSGTIGQKARRNTGSIWKRRSVTSGKIICGGSRWKKPRIIFA